VVKVNDFENEADLMDYARRLEGLRFSQISSLIAELDTKERRHTKGFIGKIIETDFFGIPTNSSDAPDFEHLGIELKVSPLRYVPRANMYTTKERNVLKMVDYTEMINHKNWENTNIKKKLNRILFVLYVHDNEIEAWEWKVCKVFLWSPSQHEKERIQSDYQLMRMKAIAGENLREGDHTFFATCPKHGGGYLKNTPLDSPRSALAVHPIMKFAEKRGYCIKREAFIEIIANSIEAPLEKSGKTIGIHGDHLTLN
jgi:DNA mismatch repair protein MutH